MNSSGIICYGTHKLEYLMHMSHSVLVGRIITFISHLHEVVDFDVKIAFEHSCLFI